jgi:hypothetical protein
MNAQSKIDEAKAAAQEGNPRLAQTILKNVIQNDPQNPGAWLVLADVVENPEHAEQCLERVLKLDPGNEKARQKLARLKEPGEDPADIDPAADFFSPSVPDDRPEPEETAQAQDFFNIPQTEAGGQQAFTTYEIPQVETPEQEQPAEPTLPPPEPQPQRMQEVPAESPPTNTEKPRKKGRWLEISLVGVIGICLCMVVLVFFGQNPSMLQSGPTPTVEDVRLVIYENQNTANREDLEGYMATIHPRAGGRSLTRNAMQELFVKYDLHYKVEALEVMEVDGKEARVAFALTTRKVNGPAFRDNFIKGVMILHLDDGSWKIYGQEVDEITYLD